MGRVIAAAIAGMLLVAGPAYAQTVTVSGTVRDASGACSLTFRPASDDLKSHQRGCPRGHFCTGILYNVPMALETSYTDARARLAELLEAVVRDRETVVIHRRGSEDVVMVAADEFASLAETAHLLRSPRNASRLLTALERALSKEGTAMTIEELRREVGLDDEAVR
jgi:antitoxin YefM